MAQVKKTLLELVQSILSVMNSDEVNSIDDTVESTQVTDIVIDTYFDLVTQRIIPEHKELGQLVALSDNTLPAYLRLPDDVRRLENDYFYYDKADVGETASYGKVTWCEPELFLARTITLDGDDSTVYTMQDVNGGTPIKVRNDRHPTYFTLFDDKHIVCNSYDSAVDSSLQASKTQAWFVRTPTYDRVDTSYPDMDEVFFPLLLSEARARSLAWLHKQVDQKAEQVGQRAKLSHLNEMQRAGKRNDKRDYGRR